MNIYDSILSIFIVLLFCRHEDDGVGVGAITGETNQNDNDNDNDNDNAATIMYMEPPPNCTAQQQNNRLECFLFNLRIDIPEESFKKDWIKITVHDMICTNFKISGLRSSHSNNNNSTGCMNSSSFLLTSELNISVGRISATCQGRYHSTGGLAGNVIATVEAQQQQQQNGASEDLSTMIKMATEALVVQFVIEGGSVSNNNTNSIPTTIASSLDHLSTTKIPKSFRTNSCTTNLHCQRIEFSGSISAKLIQAFSKTISHYITDALQQHVCPLLPKIDPLITAYLYKFDKLVKKYLPSPSLHSVKKEEENFITIMTRKNRDDKYKNKHQSNAARRVQNDDSIRSSSSSSFANKNSISKNIAEYPAILGVLKFLNEQLRYHLQKGWISLPSPPLLLLLPNTTTTNIKNNYNNINSNDSKNKHTIPEYCVDASRGISGWMKSMIGPAPLKVRLPNYFQHIIIPVSNEIIEGGATIVMNVSQLSVAGLDRMDTLQLLKPNLSSSVVTPGAHSSPIIVVTSQNVKRKERSKKANTTIKTLQTKLASKYGFFVVVPMSLEFRLSPAIKANNSDGDNGNDKYRYISSPVPLKESFQVTINITQIDVTLSNLIQVVDWESTSLLQVVDVVQRFVKSRNLHDLACLISTINKIEIGEWLVNNMLIDAIQLLRDHKDVPNESLEVDIDNTINTVGGLFLTDYSKLWTQLVRGLVHGPGSRVVNRIVRHWIEIHSTNIHKRKIGDDGKMNDDNHDSQCPPATSSSVGEEVIPKWLNFTKFEILYKFNRYLDHSHTKKTLNQFLSCLSERLLLKIGDDDYFYNNNNNDSDGLATSSNPTKTTDVASIDALFGLLSSGVRIVKKEVGRFGILIEDLGTKRKSQVPIEGEDENENLKKLVTLGGIEINHWDSIQRLQIIKPSGDTKLESFLIFGKLAVSQSTEEGNKPLPLLTSNTTHDYVPSSKEGPPQVTLIVNVDGYKFSGQINLTFFVSLEAHAEVKIDYDLNRLENLTISKLLKEINCALLPAIDVRFMPRTTSLNFGEYFGVNLTAAIGGKNFSLSAQDYPRFLEISNDALHLAQEFSRNIVNYAFEKWVGSSLQKCPGVVIPEDNNTGSGHRQNPGGKTMYWLWKDSTTLWIIFGLIAVMQVGLLFIVRRENQNDEDGNDRQDIISNNLRQAYQSDNTVTTSRATPLLSSYEELMMNPFSGTNGSNKKLNRGNSIDCFIIRDICEDFNDEDECHVILEDQLIESTRNEPQMSIFESAKIPEAIRYLIPVMIVGTIILFISSNSSVGASVDLSVQAGQYSICIPGLFQFSLGKTASELYHAGIWPLLLLVVCFSGIWPYAKLALMLYSWMRPNVNQHQQERRLLTLDALGKYSLVDVYVLILFVVAFRFHLGVSDNLGMDVYVTPIYGFFSFLLATCISLLLGHAVLFFHRRNMQNDNANVVRSSKISIINHDFEVRDGNSPKRFSYIIRGLLLLAILSTLGLLLRGFLEKSFTFEIGGIAGIALDEDSVITSYSVISLGLALPSSVESPQSLSIILLQGAFFFFTVVTPILCLTFIMILLFVPMQLKWQRYFLVAVEITRSWTAIEVFLLSIVAALFQISTFASFMIGNKCDEIDILAKQIFDEEDVNIVCFTVDASIESNCWFLVAGALLNSVLVSICLNFAENAVKKKTEGPFNERQQQSSSDATIYCWTSPVQKLFELPCIGQIIFINVPNSYPATEEDVTILEDQFAD